MSNNSITFSAIQNDDAEDYLILILNFREGVVEISEVKSWFHLRFIFLLLKFVQHCHPSIC